MSDGPYADGFEDAPTEELGTGSAPSAPVPSGPDTPIPDRIGKYRILGKLGEGGMGIVYLAEQESPKRKVAVKVVRGGQFVDAARVRMFQREADTLARLKSPNIGAIYESGCTDDGQHFFAMELVRGKTLDAYFEGQPPATTLEELRFRLSLFCKIADTVHYAHQRSVIHRDIKPSNIVVVEEATADSTITSGTQAGIKLPGIKILDFGLARITDGDVAAATMLTEVGVIKGTLPYMSPEQARGNPEEIDVRTDVYALGVLLYEMLSGQRPYDVTKTGLVESLRVICDEPPRPLTQTMSDARRLDFDVETIVGKMLEKEPDRRYSSAAAVSEDIGRYLSSQPILARPPSTIYQVRKFAGRNRALVGGVAATIVMLVAGIVVSTIFGFRESAQRMEAERVRNDLESVVAFQAAMFSGTDAEQMGAWLGEDLRAGMEVAIREEGLAESEVESFLESYDAAMRRLNVTDTALEVIDRNILGRAVETLEGRFADQPLIDARLRATIGKAYRSLGQHGRAQPLFEEALATRTRLLGDDHPDTLDALAELGLSHYFQGHLDEAEPLFIDVLERRRRVLGQDHQDTLSSTNYLAGLYFSRGRFDEAEPFVLQTLEVQRRTLGSDHRQTLASMHNLAVLYKNQHRLDDAERLYRETLESQTRVFGGDDPDTINTANSLAGLYFALGRDAEAVPLYVDTLERRRRLFGDDNMRTLRTASNLAFAYSLTGRDAEAVTLYLQTMQRQQRLFGNDHPDTLTSMNNLGGAYTKLGNYAEAEKLLRETLRARIRVLGEDHAHVGYSHYNLGCLSAALGRRDEAIDHLRKAVDLGWAENDILTNSTLDGLRDDPGFQSVAHEVREKLGR